jgi:hypothetical protein
MEPVTNQTRILTMTASFDDAENPEPEPLLCKRCERELRAGRGDFYIVSIVAVADPSPLVLTKADLARGADDEIQRLIAHTRGLSSQDAEDQVHTRLFCYLCRACYRHWIQDPTGY